MKKYIIIFLLTLLVLPSSAQKKEIDAARQNIKKGVKLEEAEKSMNSLLQNSANRGNEKIWATLFDALKAQVEQNNEKLYLKQKTDTVKFFTTTFHLVKTLEGLDSVAVKGNTVNPKYRKKHADYIMKYAGNLLGGGVYYLKKKDYKTAYDYFDTYLQIPHQSLFSMSENLPEESMHQAAYGAMVCGYELGDAEKVYNYADIARRNDARRVYVLQYLAETYRKDKSLNEYRGALEEGFQEFPLNNYFFSNLETIYEDNHEYDKALLASEKVLSMQQDNAPALLAASTACLNLERYKEALEYAEKCHKVDPEMMGSLLNAGLAYYNQAKPLLEKSRLTKDDKLQRNKLFEKAMPYLEQYRHAAPDDVESWGKPLYNIYFNLNLGDKFDAIDRLLNH